MSNNLRKKISDKVLGTSKHHVIVEAGTGIGKSKVALDKLHQLYAPEKTILIVIPRNVLIDNWKAEFKKWHYEYMLPNITFTTYVSFPKHTGPWDIVIFDEAHHLSERCRASLSICNIGCTIYLSATLKKDVTDFLYDFFGSDDIEKIKVTTKKAIEENVLPDPRILLIPLQLDVRHQNITYVKNKPKHGEKPLVIPYEQKWKYKSYKGALSYSCNQRQYYNEISGLIEWYKRKNYNPVMKNIWLHKCGERLQWLSMNKLIYTMQIIKMVHSRFIVFCNTIAESAALHIPPVNSQTGSRNLERFNDGKIDKLVAVNMLNEGMNLSNCKVGIFNAINASEAYQIQKVGRILRHKSPIIIIPYFKDTREEEIVDKWMKDYNEELVSTVTMEQLKDYSL